MTVTHDDAAWTARELPERIEALYRQGKTAGWGAAFVVCCLTAVMWQFVPSAALLTWLGVTLAAVAVRIPVLRRYADDAQRDMRSISWARRYRWIVAAHGVCWAVAPFLFLRADTPFAVASYSMVAALMPTASIPTQSNHLPAVYIIVLLAIGSLVLRLTTFLDVDYVALAITLTLYCVFLIVFARVQSKLISHGIRLRLENADLIDALKVQKDNVEAQRVRADQANLAKSQFLAAASHDLRQPLHALGLLSASLREQVSEPVQRKLVENMFDAIDSMESTFGQLLDLSRIDAGYATPHLQHFALRELFDQLLTQYSAAASSKSLLLRIDAVEQIVVSDKVMLFRVLSNLVSNAIRYTDIGQVHVSAQALGERQIEIEVRDSGTGIAPEFHKRVFDEYFQLDNPERDTHKGLGLGLSIVKRIAALLNHPLELSSELGKGTRVRLRVPAGEAEQVRASVAQPEIALNLLHGKCVLVIEDDLGVANATRELLQQWGCKVWVTEDAAAARAQLKDERPDLIIADLRLRNEASGADAIAYLRRVYGHPIAALIATGDTDAERLRQLRAQGYLVLHKPVRPAQLRASLSQLAAQSEASKIGSTPRPE